LQFLAALLPEVDHRSLAKIVDGASFFGELHATFRKKREPEADY
jgi:hypothetical protein